MAYGWSRMVAGNTALKCKKCESQLATRDNLVLGTVPPSQTHLAVRPGNEQNVCSAIRKVPNHEADVKKSAMIPFKLLCVSCETSIGSVSLIEAQQVWCFKVEAVFLQCRYERIQGKRLKQIRQKLEEVGILEFNLRSTQGPSRESLPARSLQPTRPLVYCDTAQLTDSITSQLTQDAPRAYQRELFLSAMQRNSLVYLPTGSGKTLVAAMVVHCMKVLNPDKLAVFVVDRIPLVYQQSDYLKKQLPALRFKELSGDMSQNPEHAIQMNKVLGALARKQVDVLVLTHQILLNNLADANGAVCMTDICALVIDEAHHCTGNHPYSKIMTDYYAPTPDRNKPLLLALTASPAGDTTFQATYARLQELLNRLNASACMSINSPDLVLYTNRPDSDYRVIPLTPKQQQLQAGIEEFIRGVGLDLERLADCSGTLCCFSPAMPNYRGALRIIIGKCHEKGNIKGHSLGELVTHLIAAMELNSVMGLEYAIVCLQECFELIENASTPMETAKKEMIWSDYRFIALRGTVSRVERSSMTTTSVFLATEDKFQHLISELNSFSLHTQNDSSSRGIIFVKMRKTAYKLCERLKSVSSIAETLKPMPFVGHGEGGSDGMEWLGEQEDTLKKFRSGRVKLLVSTSVLEEGLDVPVCNLIIRFDSAMSLRSLVQSRGRASRRSDSKFVVLCSDGKERQEAMELKQKEINMDQAMRILHSTSNLRTPQATKFACPVKLPDLSPKDKKEDAGSSWNEDEDMQANENWRPITKSATVRVAVHNVQKSSDTSNEGADVIKFFNENFNVTSVDSVECKRERWSLVEGDSPVTEESIKPCALNFELHQTKEEGAQSSTNFVDSVVSQWCSRMPVVNRPQAWMERLDDRKQKVREPVELVAAESLKLGYLRNRTDYCTHWPGTQGVQLRDIQLLFQHDLKLVTTLFTVPEVGELMLYEVEMHYSELENFILVDQKTPIRNTHCNVFLSLKYPPKLYRSLRGEWWIDQLNKEDGYASGDDSTDNEDDDDEDEIQIDHREKCVSDEELSEPESASAQGSVGEETTREDTAQQVEYAHPLLKALDDISDWSRVSQVADSQDAFGKCNVLMLEISRSTLTTWQSVFKSLHRWDKRVFYAPVSVSVRPLQQLSSVYLPARLTDDVKYTVLCLLTTHPSLLGRVGIQFGISLSTKPAKMAVAALEKLNNILDSDVFCQPEPSLQKLLALTNLKSSIISDLLVPGHCGVLKRLILTPTRLLFRPPEIMQKNRVLRNYEPSNFLCMNIRDEDFSRVSSAGGSNLQPVLTHLKSIMDDGVQIGGQQYVFLGCSNSQLRSHSCWFVRSECNPDVIRRWMGDFTQIRCVATYVSRMGQCFSTSLDTVGITVDEGAVFYEEPDICTEDKAYTFSDGVGRISAELTRQVTKKIKKNFIPSAFQIRFAGCKGVLAVDATLHGKQLYYRPSMRKFESSHHRLEVIQTSRPQAVFLNHQVIMLLSNLAIPDEVFISLMRNALDNLAGTLLDERRAIQQLSSSAKTGIAYRAQSDAGTPLTVEPFFRSLVAAVYKDRLLGLLHKARIQLPLGEARLMMGVMDETGVLQYGQVFVQYSAASTDPKSEDEFELSDKRVLTGPVVVTRNPCLHPGDVRVLVAVDTPRLRHLVDCVVFPKLGSRPHPSEMAGGDLDGDLYFVCWHKPLIPSPDKSLYEPMDYRAPPKLTTDLEITSGDITAFLMDYIRSDQLGVIDNAHKAQADQQKQGVESEVCIRLAEAHSYAVDAPKTGRWPKVERHMIPKEYPDFMMNANKPSYRSQKLLGKLFRACRAFKRTAEESSPKVPSRPCLDSAFLVPGYENFLDEARSLYQEYCDQLDRIAGIYGISSEAELVSGCFRKLYHRLSRERTEVAEVVSKILQEIREQFRKKFFEEFGLDASRHKKQYVVVNALHQKASAWYMAAYTADKTSDDQQDHLHRCLSFPWVVDDVMASIRNTQRRQSLLSTMSLGNRSPGNAYMLPGNRTTRSRVDELGEALMNLLADDRDMLLLEYKRRINGLQRISLGLRLEGKYQLALFGSTATFLFRKESDVDLCVIGGGAAKKLSKKEQLKLLRKLHPATRRLFQYTRLVSRARVPIISCKRFKQDVPQGSASVPFDISTSVEGLVKASIVTSYIKSFPGLLPVLRFVLRWGHVSGLTGHGGHVGVNTNALVFMLLGFCVARGFIAELDKELVDGQYRRVIQGRPDHDFKEWENVLCNLVGAPGPCSQVAAVSLGGHSLGEVLIAFLASHNSIQSLQIPPTIASFIGKASIRDLVDSRQLGLLSEHMQRAYHLLALHGDLPGFLVYSGAEIRQAIHLSTGVSCMMRGTEQQNATEMQKKTGARVTIRPKLPSTTFRLIVDARGTEFEVGAVEQLLQEITSSSGTRKIQMMSVCFVEGASQMLFAGSRRDSDPVKLEPYKSHRHFQHDGARLYTPMLATPAAGHLPSIPPKTSHEFICYKNKFLTQFQIADRDHDPSVHGDMEFAVHFGRIYIFRVPKSFIEDAECVTIDMLQGNLRRGYTKVQKAPKTSSRPTHGEATQEPTLVSHVRSGSSKRKRKKPPKKPKDEKKKKKLSEKPTKSSFFTQVASEAKVVSFLQHNGFVEVGKCEEYAVNLRADTEDVLVKFDAALKFKELCFSSLRWSLSDVKRRWKPNNEARSGNSDGKESDVRFMLQSRRALGASDIRDTEYEKYHDALLPSEDCSGELAEREMAPQRTGNGSQQKTFMVREEIWGDVNLIRHKKTREFRHVLPSGFNSRLLVHVSDVTEHSRPVPTAASCFRKSFQRHEVSIKADLPSNWTDVESVGSFLDNIWDFSLDLSSSLYMDTSNVRCRP